MALSTGTVWEFNTSATAGMVNGGGFNPTNANFISNFTTDSNTANTASPVLSTASYNFVAGDVNAWVYVKSGTNWTPGYYKIASVAANKATLNAAIGAAVQFNATTGAYQANTVVGCATVGTPTNGTCGIDYSQSTSPITNNTDLASLTGTTVPSTVTSALAPFGVQHTGNIIHITAGTNWTADWYEIVSVSTITATLDKAAGSSATLSGGTFAVGGALSLNSATLEDPFFEAIPASSMVWFKNGSFTSAQAVSVASTTSTNLLPSFIVGYNALRGDNPTGTNRPSLSLGANAWAMGVNQIPMNLIITGTAATVFRISGGSYLSNCKVTNTSVTAARNACSLTTLQGGNAAIGSEFVSQNGIAIVPDTDGQTILGCFIHDSDKGISAARANWTIMDTIVAGCVTAAVDTSNTGIGPKLLNCTLYGRNAKIGIGANLTSSTMFSSKFINNIFSGFATAISVNTQPVLTNFGFNNDYFNNTANGSNWTVEPTFLAVDPTFTDVTEITGTTATTSGSTLTQSGGAFGTVTDNVSYLHVVSGTGVTTGCYLITGHTTTTLTTNNALGTSSGGDVVYWIRTGNNFTIGNATLKAGGYPSSYTGTSTSTFPAVGAMQPQAGAGGGGNYTFC